MRLNYQCILLHHYKEINLKFLLLLLLVLLFLKGLPLPVDGRDNAAIIMVKGSLLNLVASEGVGFLHEAKIGARVVKL